MGVQRVYNGVVERFIGIIWVQKFIQGLYRGTKGLQSGIEGAYILQGYREFTTGLQRVYREVYRVNIGVQRNMKNYIVEKSGVQTVKMVQRGYREFIGELRGYRGFRKGYQWCKTSDMKKYQVQMEGFRKGVQRVYREVQRVSKV